MLKVGETLVHLWLVYVLQLPLSGSYLSKEILCRENIAPPCLDCTQFDEDAYRYVGDHLCLLHECVKPFVVCS